ncbi:ASCH domain-containing protein [Pleomorphomonas sp. JP5]|uniref:ASCH domain-containing protein n=1 Tax=Pleomorphomonas sp. JP5 TaxID=2942998 RepID=UPI002044080A|nr:ASCH domain-containing protein [Pleomorphomonas sp. JP5]MCM5556301.1 ASCH domain-containing protein [Pleomorphomonas sp. JP5]
MTELPALSIRQPWPWVMINAGKDIENRNWWTKFRGRFFIHASAKRSWADYGACMDLLDRIAPLNEVSHLGMASLLSRKASALRSDDAQLGGIVGIAEIVDCVEQSDSPWFFGRYGFVLRNACPLPFHPCKGRLGFFKVQYPYEVAA